MNFNIEESTECLLQKDFMTEEEREIFLRHFTGNPGFELQEQIKFPIEIEERSLLGFCVLGGIFSEGIDLKEDSLIGVIIVGTGLPMVCPELK